jgi:hypothetical protein
MNRNNKRRWLRFSVRTLLVAVAIICVWLGWQVSIVHERRAVRKMVVDHHGFVDDFRKVAVQLWLLDTNHLYEHSWIRRKLGDDWVLKVLYKDLSEDEIDSVKRAFSEAREIRHTTDADRIQHNEALVNGVWVDSGFRDFD